MNGVPKYNRVYPVRSNSVNVVRSSSSNGISRQNSNSSISSIASTPMSSHGRRASWNNMGGDAVLASLTSGSESDISAKDLRIQNENLVSELNDNMKKLNPDFTKPSFFSKRFLGQHHGINAFSITPYSPFATLIGMVLNLTLFFVTVSSPLRVAFSIDGTWTSDPYVDFIFFINFMKNIFIARISESGEPVTKFSEKVLRYSMEGSFVIDLVCAIPYSLIAFLIPGLDPSYLMVIRIIKLYAFECTMRNLRKSRNYRLRRLGIYINDFFEMYVSLSLSLSLSLL